VAIDKEEKAAANSFEAAALEWLERQTDKAATIQSKGRRLLQFAIDEFGDHPVANITPPMVLAACRKLEAENKLETAHRVKAKSGQVFRYAVATGRAERAPTPDLRGALKLPVVKHRAALKGHRPIRGPHTTLCALKLSPMIFIRPGEPRMAKWADMDLDAARCSYTPPKTRNQIQHIIPLSTQAVAILRELHQLTAPPLCLSHLEQERLHVRVSSLECPSQDGLRKRVSDRAWLQSYRQYWMKYWVTGLS
jgi:integrase